MGIHFNFTNVEERCKLAVKDKTIIADSQEELENYIILALLGLLSFSHMSLSS